MASILFKWFFMLAFSGLGTASDRHPVYVSVTTLTYDETDQLIEGSCKLFTNDFELALRRTTTQKVELLKPTDKSVMDTLVKKYIQSKLKVKVNGNPLPNEYVGYEQVEDAIQVYFQIPVKAIKKIDIQNSLLYELYPSQMSLMHITVKGKRQSSRLINPDQYISAEF